MKNNNFKHLIKEELVTQFENVVKDEIREKDIFLHETNTRMKVMEKQLLEVKADNQAIIIKSKCDYDDALKKMDNFNQDLENDFDSQRRFIKDNCKRTNRFILNMSEFVKQLVDHDMFEEKNNEVTDIFENLEKRILNNQENMMKLIHSFRYEFLKSFEDLEKNTKEKEELHNKKLDSLEKDLNTFKVDSQGVLRELKIYKKEAFVIEKKIEQLYTLIERINSNDRGCL